MKLATLFFVSALIFLFTSPSLSSRTTPEDDDVYDYEGNPLQIGATYRIKGVDGGRVDLLYNNGNNETSVEYAIQLPRISRLLGNPFTFIPVGEDAIKLRAPLAILSLFPNPCGEGPILKVSSAMGIPAPNIITTGGYFNTPNSCLRIVKPDIATYPSSYFLEHCPNLCGAAEKLCYRVGIYQTEGSKYLSTKGNQVFQIQFIKDTWANVI